MAAIRLDQPETEFQDGALAGTSYPENDLGFSAFELKGNAVQHRRTIEADGDVFKNDGLVDRTGGQVPFYKHENQPPKVSSSLERSTSVPMMSSCATTTACVVERPTP